MTYWSLHSDYFDLDNVNESRKNKKPITRDNIVQLSKKTIYFNNCTILTLDNKVIHNCEETTCNGQFYSNTNNLEYKIFGSYFEKDTISSYFLKINNFGVFLHTDCWNYIKNNYKIELKFSDLPILSLENTPKKYNHPYLPPYFNIIDYGKVQEYWGQEFDYIKLIDDKNEWMCESLLEKNTKNISRIKKIISQLNLKNNPKRIGPNISATFYNDNIYRIGNNGNFWITKNNKWNEINNQVISKNYVIKIKNIRKNKNNNKIINYINKIKQIGQYSTVPIFMDNLSELITPNNITYSFTISAFEEDFDKIKL